jgi:glutamyl-tRNA reductase
VSVVVIGCSHRGVDLDLLGQLTVSDVELPKALSDLASRDNVAEAVVLSTCNRVEVYVLAERFHGAYDDVRQFLCDLSHLPPEDFADSLFVHYDLDCARHLFEVTAGLDSAVVGEAEVLGQVRNAWESAQSAGTAGTAMNLLFRHALEVGKRARTETSIGRHVASVSSAAVAMATDRLGSLEGRSVLVLGAGDMANGMVRAVAGGGVAEVVVANRTWERSVELAGSVGGRAVRLSELEGALAGVDLLLTGTGATDLMVAHTDLAEVMAGRPDRPLLIVDVAVPRDVDPSAADLEGVTLLDMDDLRAHAEAGLVARRGEIAMVRDLVANEVDRYGAVSSAREVAPLVAALRSRAEDVRRAEIARVAGRLAELDERQRDAVEALTLGIVAKLLHEPTVGLKEAAGTPRGERLAESLRHLFDL